MVTTSTHISHAAISDGTGLGNGAYAVNGYAVMVTNDGALRGYGGKYTACYNMGGYYTASGSVSDVSNSCGLDSGSCGNQVYAYNLGPACNYMASLGNFCVGNSVYNYDTSCNTLKVRDCPQFCNSGTCVSSLSVGSCTGTPSPGSNSGGYKDVTWSLNGVSGASGEYIYNWDADCYKERCTKNGVGKKICDYYKVGYLGSNSSMVCSNRSWNNPSATVTVKSIATANIPEQTAQVSCSYNACYGSSDPSCKTTAETTTAAAATTPTQAATSNTNQTSSAPNTAGGANGASGLSCSNGQIPCGGSCIITPVNGQCPSDLGVVLTAAKTGSNIFKRTSLVVSKDSKINLKWEASSSVSTVICNAVNGWDSSTSSSHTTLSPIAIPSSKYFSVSCTDGIKTLLDTIKVLVVGVSEF